MTRTLAARPLAVVLAVLLSVSGAGLAFAKSTAGWHSVFTRTNVELGGVSCTSVKSCFAVGDADATSMDSVWRLSGGKWRGVDVKPYGVSGTGFEGFAHVVNPSAISCVASGCMVVGINDTADTPTANWWNGHSWKNVSPPTSSAPGAPDGLFDVSCRSSRACVAVGDAEVSGTTVGVSDAWNGKRWSVSRLPVPASNATYTGVVGISCLTASNCWAVGYYQIPGDDDIPFAEHWNGKRWTVGKLPRPTFSAQALEESQLRRVSCSSAHNCTAVGSIGDDNSAEPGEPLVENWNGKRWAIELHTTPKGSAGAALYDVSCNRKECIAVGATVYDKPGDKPYGGGSGLIARIEGSKLIVQKVTARSNSYPGFWSVTCPRSCFAVGYGYIDPTYTSFIYSS